ncbi:MAG TPA: hypothetical protein VG916_02345 [Gemmatimonadaceae bacterium]|nr:hypothetical protein [Gemmatimonadaceae bacterium]
MVADTTPEPLSLGELLTAAARRATDGQLLAMTITGITGATVLVELLGRQGWLAAAGALAVGAYGGWAIADRELNERWSRPGARGPVILGLRAARALAAVVATLAVVALLGTVFIPVLGLWRS